MSEEIPRIIELLEPYQKMSDRELVEAYNFNRIHRIKKLFGFEEDIKLEELKDGDTDA